MRAHLHASKATERIEALREHVPDYEAFDPRREDAGVAARVVGVRADLRWQVVVQRLLRTAEGPVEAVWLVDVGREHLGFAQTAVHRAREHHGGIAEDVRQRDRRAAEEAAAQVTPLIA